MNIVLDCERMKYPNTGLFTFGDKFSHAMKRVITENDSLTLYIDARTGHFLGEDVSYIERKLYHKLFKVKAPKADIWHTSYQLSKYWGGDENTKNVLTVHDLNFLYEEKRALEYKEQVKAHQKRIDRADYIITISEFVKEDVIKHLDLKGKPIKAIHSGCSLIEYPGFDAPRYRPERPFILALATIIPKKNFHVLPAILRGNDYELVIGGNLTSYSEKILEQAKLHNVEDRVKILGTVSGEEKYWYLKNCAAFAFPSLAEGLGMPVLEAMTFSKPVFLSNLTSLPEIGGKEAYFFENFDPDHMLYVFSKGMADYKANFETKSRLIMEHASKFNWDSCAQRYYEVYKSLI